MKMKMVKKLVAMALVSTMTLSGLAACGGETADTNKDTSKDTAKEDKSEGKEVLKLAAFKGGNGEEIWNQIAAAFEEEKGVDVELNISSELDKDLTKSIQKGDFPDVVYYNLGQKSGFTETMLKEGAIADITDNPAYASLSAVKNNKVFSVNLNEVYCSGVRTYDGIMTFAKALYPDLYE